MTAIYDEIAASNTAVSFADDYTMSLISHQQPVMALYALGTVAPEVPDVEVPAEVEGDEVEPEAKVVKAPAKAAAKVTEGVETK